jgi:hypothetical protein
MGGIYQCGGEDNIVLGNGEAGTFTTFSQGISLGDGAAVSHYVGQVYGIQSLDDYVGLSHSIGLTASVGPLGVTGAIFWGDASNAPAGWYAGWAPGADLSIWYADTYATTK